MREVQLASTALLSEILVHHRAGIFGYYLAGAYTRNGKIRAVQNDSVQLDDTFLLRLSCRPPVINSPLTVGLRMATYVA